MEAQAGSYVAVNLAPFIGSAVQSRQSIACRVLEVRGDSVKVCTEEPYRCVSLWIHSDWIDGVLESPCAADGADGLAEVSGPRDGMPADRLPSDRRRLAPV